MQNWLVRLSRFGARLRACRKGNSSVEFGLTLPFLILLVFGAIDYGSAYVEGVRLTGAARAGAQYPLYDPTDWDNTDVVEEAALEEYAGHPLTQSEMQSFPVSAVATTFCACTDGTTLACSSTCAGGETPGRFVRVRLSRDVPQTLPYPWVSNGQFTVVRDAVVRAR